MTVIINGTDGINVASTTGVINLLGSTSGAVTLQANAIAGTNTLTLPANTGTVAVSNTFGYKNRFINGSMQVAQRGNSATVTSGTAVPTATAGYPCVDRWFAYSTGANVTAAQVAGSGSIQNNLQITGAASVTVVGVGQRIEASNCYDMAGQTTTLSVNISNSLLTTVTWTASYATTADTFGTIGTPTKTQIATGTFTVSSTLTNYSTQINIPSAAATGIEILFTVGAQTSGTWVIGNAQLELGTAPTVFDTRDIGNEIRMCQRYYQLLGGNVNNFGIQGYSTTGNNISSYCAWPVVMRTTPTVTLPTMTNSNTAGVAANNPNVYGTLFLINVTSTGYATSLNTGGGYVTVAAEVA
jgi:hypothetical protein